MGKVLSGRCWSAKSWVPSSPPLSATSLRTPSSKGEQVRAPANSLGRDGTRAHPVAHARTSACCRWRPVPWQWRRVKRSGCTSRSSCSCCSPAGSRSVGWCGARGMGRRKARGSQILPPPPPRDALERAGGPPPPPRSPCQENDPADAHSSAHKSVLGSANLRMDSEGASGCPWSMARAAAPSPRRPTPGVVKQDKSSRGSVDTTKTRSGPQRVRMSGGVRPIGAAKGKQSDTEALCQPAPPPPPRGAALGAVRHTASDERSACLRAGERPRESTGTRPFWALQPRPSHPSTGPGHSRPSLLCNEGQTAGGGGEWGPGMHQKGRGLRGG